MSGILPSRDDPRSRTESEVLAPLTDQVFVSARRSSGLDNVDTATDTTQQALLRELDEHPVLDALAGCLARADVAATSGGRSGCRPEGMPATVEYRHGQRARQSRTLTRSGSSNPSATAAAIAPERWSGTPSPYTIHGSHAHGGRKKKRACRSRRGTHAATTFRRARRTPPPSRGTTAPGRARAGAARRRALDHEHTIDAGARDRRHRGAMQAATLVQTGAPL